MSSYEFQLGFIAIGCRARRNCFKTKRCPACMARFYCWSSISNDDVIYFRKKCGWNRPIYKNKYLEVPSKVWENMLKGLKY